MARIPCQSIQTWSIPTPDTLPERVTGGHETFTVRWRTNRNSSSGYGVHRLMMGHDILQALDVEIEEPFVGWDVERLETE